MDKRKILIVDDERDLCEILLFNLTTAGYEAETAYSAKEALQKELTTFDLLLLDVMMPGMSGFELAEMLKQDEQTNHIPIIFLTAKDTENDTLRGFSLGADDYVTKPFSVREVMARVKAVLSRVNQGNKAREAGQDHQPAPLSHQGLIVDAISKKVTVDGLEAMLTRTEFDLLYCLLSHQGKVFSRQQLLEEVWPKDVVVTERTVDVSITRLRKKIGCYAANIIARQGFGYCFDAS